MIKNIIKRVIVGVLIALVLSFISSCDVKANVIKTDDWILSINRPINTQFYNWTNATNREEISGALSFGFDPITDGEPLGDTPYITGKQISSYGISVGTQSDNYFYHDYLYRVTLFIGSKVDLTIYNSTNSVHIGGSIFQDPIYQASRLEAIDCGIVYNSSYFTKCYMLDMIVSPTYSGTWVFGRVKSSSTANTTLGLFGYTSESLGVFSPVTTTYLNNLLDSKGFATQSSVNQVNTNIQNQTTQQHQDAQQTQQKLDDINNTMKDDNTSDVDTSAINGASSAIATNNVISDLITLPITLFTNVLNSIDAGCFQYSLGSLYGTNIILPCIDLEDILGSTLYHTIDVLISGLFVYYISRKMIKIFNDFSSLNKGGGIE